MQESPSPPARSAATAGPRSAGGGSSLASRAGPTCARPVRTSRCRARGPTSCGGAIRRSRANGTRLRGPRAPSPTRPSSRCCPKDCSGPCQSCQEGVNFAVPAAQPRTASGLSGGCELPQAVDERTDAWQKRKAIAARGGGRRWQGASGATRKGPALSSELCAVSRGPCS